MTVLQSLREVLTITLLRFRPLPRVWAALLLSVNAASLLFLNTIYGQVALGAVSVGVAIIVAIHRQLGFVRLLGIGHVLWIPMLPWMASQLRTVEAGSSLYLWMVALLVCNSISLVIDAVDVSRYLLGDRHPHYRLDGPVGA